MSTLRKNIINFGLGTLLAVAILCGMVLLQYAGERIEARLVENPVAQAGR